MPVGAFGGKKEIMAIVAPEGPVYQAGNLSGNPVAMSCDIHLKELNESSNIYQLLEEKSSYLENGLRKTFEKHHLQYALNRLGSMMSFHFGTIRFLILKMPAMLMRIYSKSFSCNVKTRYLFSPFCF